MPDRYAVTGFEAGAPRPAALLVEPDAGRAARVAEALSAAEPGRAVVRCGTLAAARAHLAGTPFDAVWVADVLPDGSGLTLLELREPLRLAAPFFVLTDRPDAALAETSRAAGAAGCLAHDDLDAPFVLRAMAAAGQRCGGAPTGGLPTGGDGAATGVPDLGAPGALAGLGSARAQALLDALRAEVGGVVHAANNPLTVIAGNAQFLLELARASEMDPALARPLEDIEAAGHQLAAALARLSDVRQRLADALGTADEIA